LQVIPLIKVKQHKQTEVVNSGNRLHLLRSDGRTMCGCVVGENWQRDVEVRGTWCKRCNQ